MGVSRTGHQKRSAARKRQLSFRLTRRKTPTLHDFPYSSRGRKCPHVWVVNLTPPGYDHCIHRCVYCYARDPIYARPGRGVTHIYSNLPELVSRELARIRLCPPVSISNTTDPCQPIPEMRAVLAELVSTLMAAGVFFFITTKGDCRFLLEVPGFQEYPRKFVSVTIEGTEEMVALLSPRAGGFSRRLEMVRELSRRGIQVNVRLDPFLVHLATALYGGAWFDQVERLVGMFAGAGARHVISSTGRLSKKPGRARAYKGVSLWDRVLGVISSRSKYAAWCFEREYVYDARGTSRGYLWRWDLRRAFHQSVREVAESRGLTYAVCQELPASEADSGTITHCEGFPMPFSVRVSAGKFEPVSGCECDCRACCAEGKPPCGRPALAENWPYRIADLC